MCLGLVNPHAAVLSSSSGQARCMGKSGMLLTELSNSPASSWTLKLAATSSSSSPSLRCCGGGDWPQRGLDLGGLQLGSLGEVSKKEGGVKSQVGSERDISTCKREEKL